MTTLQEHGITEEATSDLRVTDLLREYTVCWEVFWEGDEPRQTPGEPGRTPYWRASSLGRCLRYQCLKRAGVEPGRRIDETSLRKMEAGREHHYLYRLKLEQAGFLLAWEVPVVDDDLSLSGHIDIVWGGQIQDRPEKWWYRAPAWKDWVDYLRRSIYDQYGGVAPVTVDEVKSTGTYGFGQVPPSGRSDQMLQLGGYYLLADRHPDAFAQPPERFEVVLINRDTGAYRDPIPLRQSWISEAEGRLGTLNDAWSSGSWPDCTCGLTEDIVWELTLCDFPNPGGDGCCDTTLLDRLEQSVERTRKPEQGELA